MPQRDIFREMLGELIEEYLAGLAEDKHNWLESCVIELEADGWVSVKRASGDIFNIKVSHASRK